MQRRRRCAFDSDTIEEYIQLSTIGQNQTNLFYDDKKLKWIKDINKKENQNVNHDFEGFEHVEYIDTAELPPEIQFLSHKNLTTEEVFTYHIMLLGRVHHIKQNISMFCMESRKNSTDDYEQELVSPMKSKLCLDLAIKRIHEKNGLHVVKFLIHDMSIQQFEPIVNVYFMQTQNYIVVLDLESDQASMVDEFTKYIRQKAQAIKQLFILYYSDSVDVPPEMEPNQYHCNRWNFSQVLSKVIFLQNQDHRSSHQLMNQLLQPIYDYFSIITPNLTIPHLDPTKITHLQLIVGPHNTLQGYKYIQFNDSLLLQIGFEQGLPPITDLSFYYLEILDGKLIKPENLSICPILENDTTSHYKDNDLSFTFDLALSFGQQLNEKQALVLAYRCDPQANEWRDLVLLPKDTHPPKGYTSIEQSIQNKRLSYQLAHTPYTHSYEYQISDRYPLVDNDIIPFHNEIGMFCFPDGIKIYKQYQQPRQHTFIMTSEVGIRTYCAALIFCQEIKQLDLKGYYDMAIVLCSRQNYTEQSIKLLKILYQFHLSKNHFPIERMICNIMDEIVIPEDRSIKYRYSNIEFPVSLTYPICSDKSIECLFSLLSTKNIAILFIALLLEKKIQLISDHISFPSLIIQALLSLVFPFEYTHILITTLPTELEPYLEAPVPYLLGVTKEQAMQYQDCIQVYLDTDNIIQNQELEIPEEIYDKMVMKLKQFDYFYNPQRFLEQGNLAFPLPIECLDEMIDQYSVREAFLNVMISLMCHYHEYLDKKNETIKINEFIKHKSKYKKFMKQFVDTRFFSYFIQQRLSLSINDSHFEYFDDCLREEKQQHFKQDSHLSVSDYYQPYTEDISGTYEYEAFPQKLNHNLMTQHRIIKLVHQVSIENDYESPIDIMRKELREIYKSWFRDMENTESTDVIKYGLRVIEQMKHQNLKIDAEIFQSMMKACSRYKLDDVAMNCVHMLKQFGYHKLLHLYKIYFHKHALKQTIHLEQQFPIKFYLEAKCYKCGRIYQLEDIFSNFILNHKTDQFRCTSRGTLGCNNVFIPLLLINKNEFGFIRPSKAIEPLNRVFYYHLIGLPYLHLFKNASNEEIHQQLLSTPRQMKNLELVNIASMFTEYEFEDIDNIKNEIYQAVQEAFGSYLKEFKKTNIKPIMGSIRHDSTYSE